MWMKFNHKLVNLDYIFLITREYQYKEEEDQDILTGRFILLHGVNQTGEYILKEIFEYKKYPSSDDAEEACDNRLKEIESALVNSCFYVKPLE